MELQPRIAANAARICLLGLALCFGMSAWADGAQRPNPLYLHASELWQKISVSQMPADQKAEFGQRFGDLATERSQLWEEAGAVDQGDCTDECVDGYNAEINQWESDLTAFSSDAQAALDAPRLPEKGVWQASGDFNQVNAACVQAWICVPTGQVMHDPAMKIVSTPAKLVTGVCQASQADPASCGMCTASVTPPKDSCTWHLEPNQ